MVSPLGVEGVQPVFRRFCKHIGTEAFILGGALLLLLLLALALLEFVLISLVEQAQVVDDLLALVEVLLCLLLALLALACLPALWLEDSAGRGALPLRVFLGVEALVPPADVLHVLWVGPAVGCFVFGGGVPFVDDWEEGGLLVQEGARLGRVLVLAELVLLVVLVGLSLEAQRSDICVLEPLLVLLLVLLLFLDHLAVDLLLHALLHALHELLADPVHFIYHYMSEQEELPEGNKVDAR